MTLGELLLLIRKKWYIVLGVTLLCCAATALFTYLAPAEYRATATVTVSKEPVTVRGIAREIAERNDNDQVLLFVDVDIQKQVISIRANGSDKDACINAANEAIQETAQRATGIPDMQVTPQLAKKASSVIKWKRAALYCTAAAVIGLIASIMILVLHDSMKRTAKKRKGNEVTAEQG